jgi:zinc D-Ala-D-Ala dipeptidase
MCLPAGRFRRPRKRLSPPTASAFNGPMHSSLKPQFLAALLLLSLPATAAFAGRLPQNSLPKGFVYLRDVAPSIVQEMRYATVDNFTGRRVPGYEAPECVLRRDAAEALKRVQAALLPQHRSLKVYDCYRPVRAVNAFWRWSQDAKRTGAQRFYPDVPKDQLFARGFIASHSRHSTGTAIDLTLIDLPPRKVAAFDPRARYGPCTAPAAQREPDNSLDMGTGFDCLDAKSYTMSRAVTPGQHRARLALKAAMTRAGFRNYFREWWHYEYGTPGAASDVPITARAAP